MKKRTLAASVLAAVVAFSMVGAAGAAETEYEWSMDLDCTLCHAKEAAGLGLMEAAEEEAAPAEEAKPEAEMTAEELEAARIAEISDYAAMHVENFKFECATCHVESDGLATGHKKLNSGKEAKRLKKSEVDTTACSTCHQQDKLIEATAEYTGLTDSNGTVVNPHDLPAVESHESIQCTDCHQAHSGKTIDVSAMTTCNSCHHAGVFECGTCH